LASRDYSIWTPPLVPFQTPGRLQFFGDEVSVEERRMMVTALKENNGSEHPPKRFPPLSEPSSKNFHDVVTQSTIFHDFRATTRLPGI